MAELKPPKWVCCTCGKTHGNPRATCEICGNPTVKSRLYSREPYLGRATPMIAADEAGHPSVMGSRPKNARRDEDG